ncbi:MAG: biotin/lipoyl-binding protein [Planctomycetota bacterium]
MDVSTPKTNRAVEATSGRPLRLKCRVDLEFNRQQYQGRDYWVIKDPITLKYYRFEEEEFALLQMMDGETSPDQIKRRFDFEFAPQKISMQELFQFIGMLYRSSLLVSEAPNQGVELKERGETTQAREWQQSLTNILAIRFRGFDPDRALGVLDRYIGWLFSWTAFAIIAVLWLAALGLILAQFESFQNKLPSFQDFFAAENWIWLALVLAGTKVIHEFGHGLACKRFGGQCHEMGVMLLVLTPCLYANVSDSWLLKNKWHRAMIAAAGMYVEFILASIAVFIWWFSTPGIINQLALNVVFVSSVSTILFNANPLLRYDGYYILSDVLEIPNLRSKATSVLQRTFGNWLLGIEARHDPFLPTRRKWLFGIYSVAAVLYRWVITFAIFWFVYRVLEPYGFKVIGQLIAITAIYGLVGMPLVRLYKFFSVPGRLGIVKPVRAAISGVGLVAIIAAVMMIPIPHYVYCEFYAQPADAELVYVDVPGSLAEIYVYENQIVQAGDPLVRLHSQQLNVQLASLTTKAELATVRVKNIRQVSAAMGEYAEGQKAAEVAEQAAYTNFRRRLLDESRLTVQAPISGLLLSPPRVEPAGDDESMLSQWHGNPLETRNLGAHLESGTMVGMIVPDLEKLEAVLAVDQANIEFLRNGQSIEMVVNQVPCTIYASKVEVVTPTEMEATPRALSSRFGGAIVTETKNGVEVPQSTRFIVRAKLHNFDQRIVPGSTGTAKIRVGSQTIAQRMLRIFHRTFQFEL